MKNIFFFFFFLFLRNQMKNILAPNTADPKKTWSECKLNIKKCTSTQLVTVQG